MRDMRKQEDRSQTLRCFTKLDHASRITLHANHRLRHKHAHTHTHKHTHTHTQTPRPPDTHAHAEPHTHEEAPSLLASA